MDQEKKAKVKENSTESFKINYMEVSFYILLVIVIFCLLPYYEAIIDIYATAAKAETGRDIYYCVFAMLISIAVMVIGFNRRNAVIKISGLALVTLFAVYPMKGYFGNNSVFKSTLNDYDFVKLDILQDNTCSGANNFQQQIADQLIAQYGDDGFTMEVVSKPLSENATYKEKLKCMPTITTMAYTLKYKDFYGKEREIVYINKETYNDLLRIASYEIIYEKMGEFLKNHQGQRHVSFKLYLLKNRSTLIDMNRSSIVDEKTTMVYPGSISLANYNMDKRIVLEVQMSDLTKRDEAHDLIDKLTDIAEYPLNIIIKYGKTTEYYLQSKYYDIDTYQEYIDILKTKV